MFFKAYRKHPSPYKLFRHDRHSSAWAACVAQTFEFFKKSRGTKSDNSADVYIVCLIIIER